eukprot:218581_1
MGACLSNKTKSENNQFTVETTPEHAVDGIESLGYQYQSDLSATNSYVCYFGTRSADHNIGDTILTDIFSGFGYTIYGNHKTQKYYAVGNNICGQCGIEKVIVKTSDGTSQSVESGKKLRLKFSSINYFCDNEIKIKKVCLSVNGCCTFWITEDNKVYGHGKNNENQLGITTARCHQYSPCLIDTLQNVIDIKCNATQSIALIKVNIEIIINGFCKIHDYVIPSDVINLIKQYESKNMISIILMTGKNISYNGWIQIDGFTDRDIIKIDCTSDTFFCVDSNGTVLYVEDTVVNVMEYFVDNRICIIDIACGSAHILAIDDKYRIYSWGHNSFNQCGWSRDRASKHVPRLIEYFSFNRKLYRSEIVTIKCGYNHSYAMSKSRHHYFWGSDENGECILNFVSTQSTPHNINLPGVIDVSLGVENTKLLFESPVSIKQVLHANVRV